MGTAIEADWLALRGKLVVARRTIDRNEPICDAPQQLDYGEIGCCIDIFVAGDHQQVIAA